MTAPSMPPPMPLPPLDNPFLEDLGVVLEKVGPGRAVLALDIAPRHLNRQRVLQGGVAATLMDAACGYAGLVDVHTGQLGQALTLMIAVSFTGRADRGRVRAIGRVTHAGRKLFFCEAQLLAEDGTLVATAQGSFKHTAAAPAA